MIVTLAELKQQLNLSDDLGTADDALVQRKGEAAQNHIERMLGFKIAARFGIAGQDDVPPVLKEAVLMLAAHWYENREASLIGVTAMDIPFGVIAIVNEYREYTFG